MKTIYFIRHAETEALVDGVMAGGEYETALTDKGRQQAMAAGRTLRDKHVELIVCSPMQRTKETATIIAQEIGIDPNHVIEHELIVERAFGKYSGRPFHEYQHDLHNDQLAPGEVEETHKLEKRVREMLDWLRQRPEDVILVVSHGATGRMFRVVDQQLPHSHYRHVPGFKPAEIDAFDLSN